MNVTLMYTVITLSVTGGIAAIILFFVAKKFKVSEDPRIDEVQNLLPGANCGGCGYPGCRNFAEAIIKKGSLEALNCPVGGNDVMQTIAKALGWEAAEVIPMVAVIRCSGSPEHRPRTNEYDGPKNCRMAHNLYMGETGCPNGCLGFGDCVVACQFDAIHMNPVTQLPEVIDDKCTACGACVRACPCMIIELRKKNKKDRKIFVSCVNTEKGAVAKKNCAVACIGCEKCFKVCPHDAITMANNLAYIDHIKCKLCRKCVVVCPTNAILEINFPLRKTETSENTSQTETKEETAQ